MAALSNAGHRGTVGSHVSVAKELTALGATERKVAGVVSVKSVVVDPPRELKNQCFLLGIEE